MAGADESSRWTDALLDRMRELGDPVADIPVAAVLERDGVAEMYGLDRIHRTLHHAVDAHLEAAQPPA